MKNHLQQTSTWLILAGLFSIALTAFITGQVSPLALAYLLVTWAALGLWGWSLQRGWHWLYHRWYWRWLWVAGVIALLPVYLLASIWRLHPDILPQRVTYDFIANRKVTEQLVDPALIKVERWNILGQEREVLFVHPAASGSTALVYPVMVESLTTFFVALAIAPQAWTEVGDGVTFSVYVEDNAGIHILFSQYVDPKHQEQDRRWLPIRVSLSSFEGKQVRFILVVNSGPAGDLRFDWAGWGEPRLERPVWP
jgi:hypothetical protein